MIMLFLFFKHNTAYEMRISDWSSDVCSSDLSVDLADYAAEWKWDGIRVQIVRGGGETRIYSRGGEEISGAFPELVAAFDQDAVIDGELLVRGEVQGGEAASFNALQQRLGRKVVSKKKIGRAHV